MNVLNSYVLRNGMVYKDGKFSNYDIKVVDGKIVELGLGLTGDYEFDVSNKLVTSSFIDAHVHLRDPGFTHKEDIETGSLSAVRGGYSHIFAMPNTNPVMDNIDLVKEFTERVNEVAHCNVLTFAAITKGLLGEELTDFDALSKCKIAGFSDDGKGVQDDNLMLDAITKVAELDSIMSLHCEDENELGPKMGSMNLGKRQEELGEIGINNLSESNMVGRDIDLLNKVGCRYHVCHVSATETINEISRGKRLGLDVSGEVSPHHLILCEDDITNLDTKFKMNPPLRSAIDRDNVVRALNSSVLNIIATDHAPHTDLEKGVLFKDAPFGIVGLETSFSVLYTNLVLTQKVMLSTILDAMTCNPAMRFGVEDLKIEVGCCANLTVIDLNKEVVYSKDSTVSRSSNSPFFDQVLRGSIDMTFIENCVYDWSKDV